MSSRPKHRRGQAEAIGGSPAAMRRPRNQAGAFDL